MSEVTIDSDTNTDEPTDEELRDGFDANYVGEPKVVDQNFVYPQQLDPARLDDPSHAGSVYLDVQQRERAEVLRAKVEDREPDLEDPPATCGTPLMTVAAASKNIPGDVLVHAADNGTIDEAIKSLPVVVGVNEENLAGNAAAMNEREKNAVEAGSPLDEPRYTDGPNTEAKLAETEAGDPNRVIVEKTD
jgi:hypothetical protein